MPGSTPTGSACKLTRRSSRPSSPAHRHPGWVFSYGSKLYYNPGIPDVRQWVADAVLDAVTRYWTIGHPKADYAKLLPWWHDQVAGTDVHLYLGEAAYQVGSPGAWSNPAELPAHLRMDRDYPGVRGNAYFSARSVRADTLGAMSRLVAEHYRHPPVHAPALVRADRTSAGVELRWELEKASEPTSFAVYRFDGQLRAQDCGITDATHLLATVRERFFLDTTAATGRPQTYYVTALDRLSAESEPTPCLVA